MDKPFDSLLETPREETVSPFENPMFHSIGSNNRDGFPFFTEEKNSMTASADPEVAKAGALADEIAKSIDFPTVQNEEPFRTELESEASAQDDSFEELLNSFESFMEEEEAPAPAHVDVDSILEEIGISPALEAEEPVSETSVPEAEEIAEAEETLPESEEAAVEFALPDEEDAAPAAEIPENEPLIESVAAAIARRAEEEGISDIEPISELPEPEEDIPTEEILPEEEPAEEVAPPENEEPPAHIGADRDAISRAVQQRLMEIQLAETAAEETVPAESIPAETENEPSKKKRGRLTTGKKRKGEGPDSPAPKKPRAKGKKIPTLAVICIALAAILLGLVSVVYFSARNFFYGPDKQLASADPHSYTVSDANTLARYLEHPALREGDIIVIEGDLTVDVNEAFGGFLQMPLVNLDCSAGSLTLRGGTVVMIGAEGKITLDGLTSDGCNVYIDAEHTDIEWLTPDCGDGGIRAGSLNGNAHLESLDILTPGSIVTLPVLLQNVTSSEVNGLKVSLTSPGLILSEGSTVTVNSLPAGGTVTVEVQAIAASGGRWNIEAIGCDAAGNVAVIGSSGYVDIAGAGWYAGDPHTHDSETSEKASSTVTENVRAAYDAGLSYLLSVGLNCYPETLTDSALDTAVSGGSFLQISAIETGEELGTHLILVGYPESSEAPSYNYGEMLEGRGLWNIQKAVNQTVAAGGAVLIPHPTVFGSLSDVIDTLFSVTNVFYAEILDPSIERDTAEWTVLSSIANNRNSLIRNPFYFIGTSNARNASEVGINRTVLWLDSLSEGALVNAFRSGASYITNGPSLSFTMGGVEIGGSYSAIEGEQTEIRFTASSAEPLTTIRLYRYVAEGAYLPDGYDPELVQEVNLTGQGLNRYAYSGTLAVDADSFYRLEISSEKSFNGRSTGYALSGPIWVTSAPEGQTSDSSILSLVYDDSAAGLGSLLAGSMGGRELALSDSGIWAIVGDGKFTTNALSVDAGGNRVSLTYHRLDSETRADYLSVMVTAPDGTTNTETIYIAR